MSANLLRDSAISSPPALGSPCVLVVDDDDALRLILTRELRKRGFDVYSTDSGAEAVEMYCRSSVRIDVILMDVNMPVMSGPDAFDAIRLADPHARCCFMTADNQPGRRAALLACGAVEVFGKPFASVEELGEALKRLILNAPSNSDPVAGGILA